MKKTNQEKIPIKPKKRLGQNFLTNKNVQQRIIQSCDLTENDVVLEIGAGLGAITKDLAKHVRKVYALETDKELCRQLSEQTEFSNLEIIHADVLKYNFKKLPKLSIVVGNLPYNISTPIIEKIIQERHIFSRVFITVQLEFAQRLVAKPGTKAYGSLSCFIQYYADAEILFKISKTSFYPVPKVTSCFVKLSFRDPKEKARNEKLLFTVIQQAFKQRRKKILNSLTPLINKNDLQTILRQLKIDENQRPENLTLKNYINITDKVS